MPRAKTLLTGLARCGQCGGSLDVRSRSHGKERALFYACSSYWRRGKSVCENRYEIPLKAADEAVIDAMQDELLTPAFRSAGTGKSAPLFHPTQQLEEIARRHERA